MSKVLCDITYVRPSKIEIVWSDKLTPGTPIHEYNKCLLIYHWDSVVDYELTDFKLEKNQCTTCVLLSF